MNFVQKIEQIFQKMLDKSERLFYNIKQNKRAEQMYNSTERKRCAERIFIMTTSNAKKIVSENKSITMTTRVRRNNLAIQKLVGVLMLAFVAVALMIGGELSAAVVIAPIALIAIFSKERFLDFGIFSNNNVRYYR